MCVIGSYRWNVIEITLLKQSEYKSSEPKKWKQLTQLNWMIVSATTIMLPSPNDTIYEKNKPVQKIYVPHHLMFVFLFMSYHETSIEMRLVPLNMFICPPVIFTDTLFLLFLCHVCLCMSSCLFLVQPCDYLLGKGWPLGSLVCDVFLCFCHFPIWCPGSGVLLDSMDSWCLYGLQ